MDLDNCRIKIDEIDDEILQLFKKRIEIAKDMAKYKADNNLPVFNPQREREILYRVCSSCDEETQNFTKILFGTIIDITRTYQSTLIKGKNPIVGGIKKSLENKMKSFPQTAYVACQGIEGAYSQIAADSFFSAPKIMYMNTFDGVFRAVEKGLCAYGVLPIENSTAGSVTEVYELMKKYHFHIARSVKLRINHVLLARENVKFGDIKEIFSHEQAITQCSGFLKDNPQVKVTVCENTAVAAKVVADSGRTDVAALSSKNCAGIYNLSVLSNEVQNSDNNYTRFICISKDLQIYNGADKISLMLTLDNKAGALYSLLTKFSVLGLNLTKLESRPMKGTDFEFMFYFDVDGSVEDEKVLDLIGQLADSTDYFDFLGNYGEA
ncbi:MAG: chorismate mutase [Eubacterium sp.]|jgi:chorismate mutase/prephenate dehydratase|nr:chorismate mutase [Eubacterium sp.]